MEKQEIIENLKEARQALVSDNYKTWSYVIMTIDATIHSLTSPKQDEPERGITINHFGKVSAEEVLKHTWKNAKGKERWLNDDNNVKYYREDIVLQAMHTYPSQVNSEDNYDFNGTPIDQLILDAWNKPDSYQAILRVFKEWAKTQSNAEAMREHAIGFHDYIDKRYLYKIDGLYARPSESSSNKYTIDEIYQEYLNNNEK